MFDGINSTLVKCRVGLSYEKIDEVVNPSYYAWVDAVEQAVSSIGVLDPSYGLNDRKEKFYNNLGTWIENVRTDISVR